MSEKKNIYLDLYIESAQELIENMQETISALEQDPENSDLINDMFRAAHTFKGNSAALGFQKIADLTHKMENVMGEIRSKNLSFNPTIFEIFHSGIELIEELIGAVKSNSLDSVSTDEVVNKLKEILEKKEEATTQKKFPIKFEIEQKLLEEICSSSASLYFAEIKVDEENQMKSVKVIAVIEALSPFSNKIISAPSEDDIMNDKFNDIVQLLILSDKTEDILKKEINSVSEIQLSQFTNLEKNLEKLKTAYGKKEKPAAAVQPKIKTAVDTIRIKASILDELLNAVSEMKINLSIFSTELLKNNLLDFLEKFSEIEKINFNMQQNIVKARLMPIATVFNKYPKMMADLAKSLNKEFDFSMSGEDTELDKNVIDAIGDLIVHLLRNSADHGIEKPEDRVKVGKSRKGKIELKAYYESSFVIIEIVDDGKGINGDIVAKKAYEKGLITQEQLEKMSYQEKIELIFLPGFSTAEQVTAVSGRGVGMDAVKAGVEKLRGRLVISSELGKGSRMRIQLPLTLAIIPALICSVNNMIIAVSMEEILYITTVEKDQIIEEDEYFYIKDNNRVMKLFDARKLLNYRWNQTKSQKKEQTKYDVIIYKILNENFAVLIDQIIEQYDIVIKPVSKYFQNVKGIIGTTILRDGTAAPIFNLSMYIK
ncbi:MAG TPA: chemotaxis protein CheA [bacterium]|nr:chemotaxis protein CheA [bacterium]HOL48754.1 chemotaxis protein CheA [bacterium]HPQ19237.1 chemotaxis protein CheA [bacterium]